MGYRKMTDFITIFEFLSKDLMPAGFSSFVNWISLPNKR